MAAINDPFKTDQPAGGIVDPFKRQPVSPADPLPKQEAPRFTRTWGEVGKDTLLGIGQGAVNLVGGVASLAERASFVNPLRDAGARLGLFKRGGTTYAADATAAANEWFNDRLSPTMQRKKQELAETEGFVASAKKVVTDPALAGQFLAEQVPNLATLGFGTAASATRATASALGRGLARDAAEEAGQVAGQRFLTRAGTAIESGNAAQQARDQALAQPDEVWDNNPAFRRLVDGGMSRDDAKKLMANEAAAVGAAVAAPLAAAGARVSAPFETKLFTRGVPGGLRGLATPAGALNVVRGAGAEAAEETVQEGGSQFASNLGNRIVNPEQDLLEGVPEAAGTGAAVGGLLGGGMAAGGAAVTPARFSRPKQGQEAAPEPVAAQPAPTPSAAPEPAPAAEQPIQAPEGAPVQAPAAPDLFAAKPASTPSEPAAQAPRVPFPDAPAGSLQAAVNAMGSDAPGQVAAAIASEEDPTASATSSSDSGAAAPGRAQPVATGSVQELERTPAAPPWINPETGEFTEPSDADIAGELTKIIEAESQSGRGLRGTNPRLAEQWGVDVDRVRRIRREIMDQRKAVAAPGAEATGAQPAAITTEGGQTNDAARGGDAAGAAVADGGAVLGPVAGQDDAVRPSGEPAGDATGATGAPVEAGPAAGVAAPTASASPDLNEQAVAAAAGTFKTAYLKAYGADRALPEERYRAAAAEVMQAIAAKDVAALRARNLGDPKASAAARAVFQAQTGIKLPKGRQATHDALDAWAGITPEQRQQLTTERKQAAAAERQAKTDAARAPRKVPDFKSWEEAQAFIEARARSFPSMKAYTASPEYAEVYAKAKPLHDAMRAEGTAKVQARADAAGVKAGDVVETTSRSIMGVGAGETVRGRVFLKNGRPWVRVDGGRTITVNKDGKLRQVRSVPWGENWTKPAAAQPAAVPDKAPARADERRANEAERARIDALPADERDAEIARLRGRVAELEREARTNALTGLPNKAAFEADAALGWPTVAAIDMDGLKRLNDSIGHENADAVLRALAREMDALASDTVRFYHRSGDEFAARFQDPAEGAELMAALQSDLEGVTALLTVEVAGQPAQEYQYRGIGISYGLGADYEQADLAANAQKRERAAAGLREDPRADGPSRRLRAVPRDPEGREGDADGAAAGAQEVAPRAAAQPEETPAPAGVSASGARDLSVRLGDQVYPVESVEDAGRKFDEFREAADAGARDLPTVELLLNGEPVAKFSYNGRLWSLGAERQEIRSDADLPAAPAPAAAAAIEAAAAEAATSPENDRPAPTDAQKEAGNYKKGHVRLHGLDIAIENPAGTRRRPEWPPLAHHYGYIKRTEGADGDHVDVFLGENAADASLPVFVVNQVDRAGKFDEHKVVMGFADEAAAREAYLANYSKGWTGLGSIRGMTIEQFKAWLASGDTTAPAPSPKPLVRMAKGKPTFIMGEQTLAAYFQPGRIVKAYIGQDRVLQFQWAPERWRVQVQAVDTDGMPTGEPPRWHSTAPSLAELREVFGDPEQYVKAPRKAAADAPPARTEAVKAKPAQAEGNTEDSGAELWFNRRNRTGVGLRWDDIAGLNDTLKVKEAVKSKVWPRPDYEALVGDGMHPVLARLLKEVYDGLAAKPSVRGAPSDEDLRLYVETVAKVREETFAALQKVDASTVDYLAVPGAGPVPGSSTFVAGLSELEATIFPGTGRNRYGSANPENNRRALLIGGNKAIARLRLGIYDIRKAAKEVAEGWPKAREAWERMFTIRTAGAGSTSIVNGEPQRSTAEKFYVTRKGTRFIVGGEFDSREAAIEKARELAAANRKKGETLAEEAIDLERAVRTGAQRRAPDENITSDRLRETFGFKGVNFGNWMKGDGPAKVRERQLHLNHAYDAFADLAEVLNLPAKALSLNGMLGIAFGAQGNGRGSGAAHFVPGVNEINLTRAQGVGSLAHEFAHAMDHYFAVQAGEKVAKREDPFLTHAIAAGADGGKVRAEVFEAFRKLHETMTRRPLTPEEQASRTDAVAAADLRRLESWIKPVRAELERRAKPEQKERALAEFDALAERLRAGDLGEGYVPTAGARGGLRPALADMRNLIKDATGRVPDKRDFDGLAANATARAYAVKNRDEIASHIPQTAATNYLIEAGKLDKDKRAFGGGNYWKLPTEMLARAFQSYVLDRLADRGARNDYLTRPQMDEATLKAAQSMGLAEDGDRYPRGDERKAINEAFDALVAELRTREEGGNVVLFSQPDVQVPVVEADASTVAPEELWRDADAYYRENLQGTTVEGPNGPVRFSKSGRGKALATGRRDPLRMGVAKRLGELARVARVYEEADSRDGAPGERFVYAAAPVVVGGKTYAVRMVYRTTPELGGDAALYTFEGYEISDPGAVDRGRSSEEPLDVRGSPGSGLTVADLAAQFKPSQRAFSQGQGAGRGAGVERVEGWLAPTVGRWGDNAPLVRVVSDPEGFPDRAKAAPGYRTAEGFYDDVERVVYLVASALPTQRDALRVLTHEAVGHYGVEAITGPVLWEQIGNTVARMRENGRMPELFAEVDRRYRGANASIALRETLAVMAEKGVRNSVMDRAIAALRTFLRKVLGLDLRFTEAELRQHLVAAARYVRDGRRPQQAAPAASAEPAFSKGTRSAYKDAMAFASSVRAFLDGKLPGRLPIQVTEGTPDVLVKLGAPDVPITINRETLSKFKFAGGDKHPEITQGMMAGLVRHLHEPVAVFDSTTEPGALVVMTEVDADGKRVMASLHVRATAERITVNRVTSLYGRERREDFVRWAKEGRLRYLDRTRVPAWLTTAGLQLPGVGPAKTGTARRVLSEADVIKPFSSGAGSYSLTADPFYSALVASVQAARGAPRQGNAAAWKGWLDGAQRRGEFRQAERDWLGVDAWLEGRGDTTREELADFVRTNAVQVSEVVLDEKGAELPDGWSVDPPLDEDGNVLEYGDWVVVDEAGIERGMGPTREQAIADAQDESYLAPAMPKFSAYQLPGGENYRELLLTLPRVENPGPPISDDGTLERFALRPGQPTVDRAPEFRSSHFDQPNILAHVRFNERTDADGKRVLFLEEIQSDWHQAGRKKGYGTRTYEVRPTGEGDWHEVVQPDGSIEGPFGSRASAERWAENERQNSRMTGVPDAPFKGTDEWAMLAFKRMARWAVDNGFDRIAWTTGDQQNERYRLSAKINSISSDKARTRDDGSRSVFMDVIGKGTVNLLVDANGIVQSVRGVDLLERMAGTPLDEVVGKPIAEQIMSADAPLYIDGAGLDIGGEGMRGFYDKILPSAVNKWAKKMGGRVGETKVMPSAMLPQNTKRKPVAVHSLDITPAMREAVSKGQPLFSQRAPADVVKDIEEVMSAGQDASVLERARTLLKDLTPAKVKDAARSTWLGALATNHLTELGSDYFKGMRHYSDFLKQMEADRNTLMAEGEDIAERVRKWAAKNRAMSRRLFDLMHTATIDGVDPSTQYQPLQFRYGGALHEATRKNVAEAIKAIRQQMRERSGDSKQDMLNKIKALTAMQKAEQRRKGQYGGLVARWNELSPEAQQAFKDIRDAYRRRSEAVEEALVQRIEGLKADGVGDGQRRAMVAKIREQFETNRLQGVYFPLQRFGRYFVAAEKDDTSTFLMYESLNEAERAEKDLKARGWKITSRGKRIDAKAADAPSGTFVAEVISELRKANISEKTQDSIYQLYLNALPELSMRKHQIHRKAVPGFDPDAVRAFGWNMQHGAHQLAKLRYMHKLEGVLKLLKDQQAAARKEEGADVRRIAAGDAILEELDKRHEWIANPVDSNLTNLVSSFGFVYYLGLTPAAALVNLSQTAIVTFPVLAAKFGPVKAMNALLAGGRDSMRTVGNIDRTLTDPDEQRAYAALKASGAIDKTQAHNLAGIAEGGVAGYNPAWAKAMEVIGWAFHKAEVVNREASAMAAYRLAREQGMDFDAAVRLAHDAVVESHFDYSNANRARFMQSGAAKVLLMFRQYSLNVTWFLARNVWQATKGADPETRKLARRKLAGVLGMTSLFSGVLGLPLVSVTFGLLNAVAASFGDDDEPWDAETEFRNFLADMLGPDAARVLASGVANELTGADIAGRTSLSQLWFRDADRELDGRGAYYNLLEQAAGPLGGVLKNALVGKQQIDDGHLWRGIETMLPKSLKDGMKGARYAIEGVNNLRGDPVVEDVSLWQALLQVNGFTPAQVARQYDANSAVKGYERSILDRRQRLIDAYAMAWRLGDQDGQRDALAAMTRFSRVNPELAINAETIRRSMRARLRYTQRAEDGIVVNPKLEARLRGAVRFNGEGEG